MLNASICRRPRQLVLENRLRHKHRREHVGDQADRQGHRKALHRTFPEQEQKGAGYHRGDVRVDNRPPGFIETGVHRRHDRLAGPQFLADALEDQHVRIHRHTDGQDHAGDARQRQRRVEIGDAPPAE